jgi:hypothetical protein
MGIASQTLPIWVRIVARVVDSVGRVTMGLVVAIAKRFLFKLLRVVHSMLHLCHLPSEATWRSGETRHIGLPAFFRSTSHWMLQIFLVSTFGTWTLRCLVTMVAYAHSVVAIFLAIFAVQDRLRLQIMSPIIAEQDSL